MLRNFDQNRLRNDKYRSDDFRGGRNRDRHNWRDNRVSNNDTRNEIHTRSDNSPRSEVRNVDSHNFTRSQVLEDTRNYENVARQNLQNSFTTPKNDSRVHDDQIETTSPILAQLKNLFNLKRNFQIIMTITSGISNDFFNHLRLFHFVIIS